jgi:hypothetical protein
MSNPAGWYPQPDGRQRYWDGQQWTENFAPGVSQPVSTPATSAGADPGMFPNEQPAAAGGAPAGGPVQVKASSSGSNGLAVAGFILALVGLLVSWVPLVNAFGDALVIVGLILAIVGLVQSRVRKSGRGLSITAIVLAALALVISGVVNVAAINTVTSAVKSLPTIAPTPLAPATTVGLGQTITLHGNAAGSQIAVTATNFVDPATSTDALSTPAAGDRYVAVQFQIQNTGRVTYFDAPVNAARVADVRAQQFDATLVRSADAGPVLPATVTLSPGKKALGYVLFAVPTSTAVATVQFAMDSGYAEAGQWTLP